MNAYRTQLTISLDDDAAPVFDFLTQRGYRQAMTWSSDSCRTYSTTANQAQVEIACRLADINAEVTAI